MKEGNPEGLHACFSGLKLYGDDFTPIQINQWYEEESEGYANLGSKDLSTYKYLYHTLNHLHGFRYLNGIERFDHVLGFGSAYGHEFEPIINSISRLTIIEPSEQLRSKQIGTVTPTYVKPNVDGKLDFQDETFDLITCFGVLHHIPNVSFVLSEILRVLKKDGVLLLREPINSMGDWTQSRPGLTRNERGIPVEHFERIFKNGSAIILHRSHCFTMNYQLEKLFKSVLKKPLYTYGLYIRVDRLFSALLRGNVRYHATSRIHRIAPSSISYVVRKT